MRDVYKPFVAIDDPDRDIRCQDALQFAFHDLVAASVKAGWNEEEALEAIIALADDSLRRICANDDAQTLLDMLRKMA
ncbi:hypothetical protein [Rhizobium mesoamericanum]|uniref:Uncharacterized protein n=1 Tax=Rhizobium mesoamericanum STM3625 TaxID=1211777 RepID=K0PX14_9HYPH|nr:hypothetical protein [Rhizobium mesoamericanum]CCM74379.1 hypothetical protein BN77_1505 [Rhizobium mesoamericanum STM3625]